MLKLVVLCGLVAAAAASGALVAPLAYGAPLGYSAPLLAPFNYRGPLSLAPGQPANILAADGRPLDTLDVNLDRAAHYTAKAYEGAGIHLLKKRSVASVFAPSLAYTAPWAYSAPLLTPYNYRGPLSLAPGQPANILAADGRPLDTLDVNLNRAAHFTAKHFLKKRSVALAPALYRAPLLTPYVPTALSYSAHYSAPLAHVSYAAPIVHALY